LSGSNSGSGNRAVKAIFAFYRVSTSPKNALKDARIFVILARFQERGRLMYNPIVWLLLRLIDLYTWVIIIAVVMSWLVAFGVINMHNRLARSVVQALDAVTEPVFRQVRRVIPPIGGLDLSPLIVLIALQFVSYVLVYYF
jgi:YggT family protein